MPPRFQFSLSRLFCSTALFASAMPFYTLAIEPAGNYVQSFGLATILTFAACSNLFGRPWSGAIVAAILFSQSFVDLLIH
jgi:hypothetical protein